MARIQGVEERPGLAARLAFFLSRRTLGKVVRPLRIHALSNALLYAMTQMLLGQKLARRLPARYKLLGQLRVAQRIGCPF